VAATFTLTIVGETWEGWHLPAQRIAESRYRDRIRFVNQYVEEVQIAEFFEESHALVLPYRRASSSGPLQIAMSQGKCVVVYDVPGLREVTRAYEGTIAVPPNDVAKLAEALVAVREMKGGGYSTSTSWLETRRSYSDLFASMGVG
jgi:glycosyltransferase involved in cell wall biosynthesis